MSDTSAATLPPCPECSSEYTYEMPPLIVCPECAHEFSADAPGDPAADESMTVIVDSVGNALADGDTVTITKTLKVKGAQQPLKAGTKVRGIRLNFDAGTGQEDHNIDCKIDGFGAMKLKPAVVKKV
ncbi:zinc ribbon domain-containing protein YjdM [Corynebacterium striatum]|uniref:zinc ribbon domain-containing protein YjdM n=1 Tax=Corynebacterium striatum TaxID=43770 RepID=UPI001A2D2D72|nr:zinc ribbon domain-containing protein YjdM [uncultured Corynebacterium sp.]HAT1170610.1 alkylphosphonate utilization protein [Corynebacterium striatum]HAT1175698.1 alkylphosphonate utilization protein [Corynebacterium striatum]HAT1327941.1 alkylphosphonate utilization protein [Corynebacterium striatum]HAT1330684.1 alkylphosphonate utilization protein [Corynebacterium striatum]HAT1337986.1 alkylphosphonate utilization protein [Corynebacterium striatum]